MEAAVHNLSDVVIAIFAQKQGIDFARLFDVIEVEFFWRDIVILHPRVEVCVGVSGCLEMRWAANTEKRDRGT